MQLPLPPQLQQTTQPKIHRHPHHHLERHLDHLRRPHRNLPTRHPPNHHPTRRRQHRLHPRQSPLKATPSCSDASPERYGAVRPNCGAPLHIEQWRRGPGEGHRGRRRLAPACAVRRHVSRSLTDLNNVICPSPRPGLAKKSRSNAPTRHRTSRQATADGGNVVTNTMPSVAKRCRSRSDELRTPISDHDRLTARAALTASHTRNSSNSRCVASLAISSDTTTFELTNGQSESSTTRSTELTGVTALEIVSQPPVMLLTCQPIGHPDETGVQTIVPIEVL
jgi:hypothetical protein